MRKILLTSVLMGLVFSAFAEDPVYITEGSKCTNTTTGTTGGNISLRTVYQPKSIPITWESNGTTYTTSTCTYDTQLQMPVAPTRMGFTFDGWLLYQEPTTQSCTMPSVNTSTYGTSQVCLDIVGNVAAGKCYEDGYNTNAGNYGVTTAGEWAVSFSYGLVNGDSLCSETSGSDMFQTGNPTSTTGYNCWCRITGYTPTVGAQCSFQNSSWLWWYKFDNSDGCRNGCAYICSENVKNKGGDLRTSFYASAGTGSQPVSSGGNSAPACSSLNLNTSINADKSACIEIVEWEDSKCSHAENPTTYGLTVPGQWAVPFSYGTVFGMAKCSAKSGDNHGVLWGGNSADWTSDATTLDSTTGEKKYCWCSATAYTPSGGSQCSLSSSSWVYDQDEGSAASCAGDCTYNCTDKIFGISAFRVALFGVMQ